MLELRLQEAQILLCVGGGDWLVCQLRLHLLHLASHIQDGFAEVVDHRLTLLPLIHF